MGSFFPFIYFSKTVKISINSRILILQVTVLARAAITRERSLDALDNRYRFLTAQGAGKPNILGRVVFW